MTCEVATNAQGPPPGTRSGCNRGVETLLNPPTVRRHGGSLQLLLILWSPLISLSRPRPRAADDVSSCGPAQRQVCQLRNARVKLHNLVQRDNHPILGRECAAR